MIERLSDTLDMAALHSEKDLEHALKIQREKAKNKLPHRGTCWYCEEPVKKPLLFCRPTQQDIEDKYSCQAEYENLQKARYRNGR